MRSSDMVLIQVAWGPRKETPIECAERWLNTQRRLAGIDPDLLGRWVRLYETDGGKIEERELVDLDTLRGLVEDGTHYKDNPPDEPIPDIGFQVSSSTGRRGGPDDVTFSAGIGLYTDNPNLMNQAHLEVYPLPHEHVSHWARIAEPILSALVEAWEPDHGAVYIRPVRRAQQPVPRTPFAGYATYLSAARRPYVPAGLPGGARETPDGGLLLSLVGPDGELPSVDEVAAVGAALRDAGAFAPTPTDRARL
jgi:hypothetical protein